MSYIVIARKKGWHRIGLIALVVATHASAGLSLLTLTPAAPSQETPVMIDLVDPLPPGDPLLPPGPPGDVAEPQPFAAVAPLPASKPKKRPAPAPKPKPTLQKDAIETTASAAPAEPNSSAIQAPESTSSPPESQGDGEDGGSLENIIGSGGGGGGGGDPCNSRPRHLVNPAPPYPSIARRRGEEGTVTLRFIVNARGMPERVMLQASSGSAALDEAAQNTVSHSWRFVPAKKNCTPIQVLAQVSIRFRLE